MLVMLLLQQLVSEITSVIKLSFVHDKNDLEPFSWELGGEKKKKEIYFLLTQFLYASSFEKKRKIYKGHPSLKYFLKNLCILDNKHFVCDCNARSVKRHVKEKHPHVEDPVIEPSPKKIMSFLQCTIHRLFFVRFFKTITLILRLLNDVILSCY